MKALLFAWLLAGAGPAGSLHVRVRVYGMD
jgi:hypothetical protein